MKKVFEDGLCQWDSAPSNVFECENEVLHNNDEEDVIAYTNGKCYNGYEPHAGGAAYVMLKDGNVFKTNERGLLHSTSNRAELIAMIDAVANTPECSRIDIYANSQYAINVLSGRYTPKANDDLVAKFRQHSRSIKMIVFHWMSSCNGDKYNRIADNLASHAQSQIMKENGVKRRSGFHKSQKS